MNVNMFAQQIDIHWRLADLFTVEPPAELLPLAFKELGIASDQVAAEELHQQNGTGYTNGARSRMPALRTVELAPTGLVTMQ